MTDDNVTPAQLREDAASMREISKMGEAMELWRRGALHRRAAVALERWADELEDGR